MKEATGELNATVVVVMAIGVLMAFFYYTLWPLIKGNFERNTKCNQAICLTADEDGDGYVECHSKDNNVDCLTNSTECFQCVFKG